MYFCATLLETARYIDRRGSRADTCRLPPEPSAGPPDRASPTPPGRGPSSPSGIDGAESRSATGGDRRASSERLEATPARPRRRGLAGRCDTQESKGLESARRAAGHGGHARNRRRRTATARKERARSNLPAGAPRALGSARAIRAADRRNRPALDPATRGSAALGALALRRTARRDGAWIGWTPEDTESRRPDLGGVALPKARPRSGARRSHFRLSTPRSGRRETRLARARGFRASLSTSRASPPRRRAAAASDPSRSDDPQRRFAASLLNPSKNSFDHTSARSSSMPKSSSAPSVSAPSHSSSERWGAPMPNR